MLLCVAGVLTAGAGLSSSPAHGSFHLSSNRHKMFCGQVSLNFSPRDFTALSLIRENLTTGV